MDLHTASDSGASNESLLFRADRGEELSRSSSVFSDLNLDQLFRFLNEGREGYGLDRILRTPLRTIDDILHREAIFRDLEEPTRRTEINRFCEMIAALRRDYTELQKVYYAGERQASFLDLVSRYCSVVRSFTDMLGMADIGSQGLQRFNNNLQVYIQSKDFRELSSLAAELRSHLSDIRYCLLITSDGFSVEPFVQRPGYAEQLEKDLELFEPHDDFAPTTKSSSDRYWSYIDEKLLAFVSELYPDLFQRLAAFVDETGDFFHPAVLRFEEEMQFFLSYLRCVSTLEASGLPFCYPRVSQARETFEANGAYDIALALQLKAHPKSIICNDFHLAPNERITVITGANQGGKTTFARMVGQLHYLAALGCPVPGHNATLFLCNGFFTHFEKSEMGDLTTGKLEDDLHRLCTILDQANSSSLIILNEIFTSTTFRDATFLSLALVKRLIHLGAFVVWVTFIDGLACYGNPVVSLVAGGADSAPFTLSRNPPSGLTHALALAEKHGLSYLQLKKRLKT